MDGGSSSGLGNGVDTGVVNGVASWVPRYGLLGKKQDMGSRMWVVGYG